MNFFQNRINAINQNFNLNIEKQTECWNHALSTIQEKCAFDFEVFDTGIRLDESEDFIAENTQFDYIHECVDYMETQFLTEYNHEAQRFRHSS